MSEGHRSTHSAPEKSCCANRICVILWRAQNPEYNSQASAYSWGRDNKNDLQPSGSRNSSSPVLSNDLDFDRKAAKTRLPGFKGSPCDMHPDKTTIQKDTRTLMFIATLFTIAKTQKWPKCLSTDEWIKSGPRGYHTKWNKSERQIPYNITDKWNLKHDTNERISVTEKQTHRQREGTGGWQGGGTGGRVEWEAGVSRHKLSRRLNKIIPDSTGNYSQYLW